jgi:hypothetical protein
MALPWLTALPAGELVQLLTVELKRVDQLGVVGPGSDAASCQLATQQ